MDWEVWNVKGVSLGNHSVIHPWCTAQRNILLLTVNINPTTLHVVSSWLNNLYCFFKIKLILGSGECLKSKDKWCYLRKGFGFGQYLNWFLSYKKEIFYTSMLLIPTETSQQQWWVKYRLWAGLRMSALSSWWPVQPEVFQLLQYWLQLL